MAHPNDLDNGDSTLRHEEHTEMLVWAFELGDLWDVIICSPCFLYLVRFLDNFLLSLSQMTFQEPTLMNSCPWTSFTNSWRGPSRIILSTGLPLISRRRILWHKGELYWLMLIEGMHHKIITSYLMISMNRIDAAPFFVGLCWFYQGRGFRQLTGDDLKVLMKVCYIFSEMRCMFWIVFVGVSTGSQRLCPWWHDLCTVSISQLLLFSMQWCSQH